MFPFEEPEIKQIVLKKSFPLLLFGLSKMFGQTQQNFGHPEMIFWSVSFSVEEGCFILLQILVLVRPSVFVFKLKAYRALKKHPPGSYARMLLATF